MAFVGFFLSRYLAAYQLGHIAYPWDPFFGDGTRRVLDSEVSKAWRVVRPVWLLNIPLGLWILAAPWVLTGHTASTHWNDVIVGVALIVLSVRRGRITERFGGWNAYLTW